ncbi:SwmB domain-containing protein, partial [Verminephrobacter aporrectodeae]|uniref:SwmB domain-containing protein n=1 Tax=Verminephrobacter aporrectodeae TaxID=1110389 RepID=UPI002236F932
MPDNTSPAEIADRVTEEDSAKTKIWPMPPTGSTAADTTPPVVNTATVEGNQLVLTYTEAGALDPIALVRNAGFTVNTATAAITVTGAAMNIYAKTVTLTLSRAVAVAEMVTVNYTKPAFGQGVRDVAGNNAANFSNMAVTNNTQVDTTPPVINIAVVNGNQLELMYTEANSLDGAALAGNAGFTVHSAAGRAITVTGAVVDATTKIVTLTLSRTVAHGETVSVSYVKPGAGNVVQDAAGNDAVNFSNWAVRNDTPEAAADTTPPVFHSATVRGNQLVIHFTDQSDLDDVSLVELLPNDNLYVRSDGFRPDGSPTWWKNVIGSAVVNATAKTVTLTLLHRMPHDQTVKVTYTKPGAGNVLQDVHGNQAVSFTEAVTNNTPTGADTTAPVLSSATVNGNQLVLVYIEAENLSGLPLVGNAGFTVSSAGGTAITVTGAVVDATHNTVTLTLSRAVAYRETVTLSHTMAGVEDVAGNDTANFSNRDVTNITPAPPDTTAPEFHSAAVTGNQLVLTYAEANSLDAAALTGNAGFTVNTAAGATAITVSSAVVNATAKTVTLTLSRAVAATETVTVSYTKPESGAVVQDAAGNDAVSFSDRAVTNNTSSATIPDPNTLTTIASVECSDLVLSANETCTYTIVFTRAVDPLTFSLADLKTVRPGTYEVITDKGELSNLRTTDGNITWKFDLKAPDSGNSTDNLILLYIEDVTDKEGRRCGGGTLSGANGDGRYPFTTHTYTIDTTAPEINTATVNGNQLVLTYTEANTLDGAALAGNAGYAVNNAAGTAAITVSSAVVNATTKTVTLTLSRAVANTETVTVSYTKPESGAVVQDAAGNDAVNFSSQAVTNSTPGTTPGADTTAPEINTAVVTGDKLVLTYREAGTLDPTALVGNAGFTVNTAAGTTAITVTGVAVHITDKTVTLTLSRAVAATETVTVSYTKPTFGNGVRDAAGNEAANFREKAVTHSTPADTTAPVINTAVVTGDKLVLTYTEANTLDGAALAGNAGFTVNTAAGATAITVSSAVVNATAKTVTLTLSRTVAATETVTVSYTKPESGAVVQDAAGNDAANFSERAVTHSTPAPAALDVEITLADSALTTGETTTVTFTFTRPVNGFDIPDLSCTNGTLSAPVANAARTVWTATFTPTANVNAPANTINVVLTGVTDDAGNAGEGEVSSGNYTVDTTGPAADTTAPVFSSATVTGNQLVLTYTEANTLDGAALTGNAGFTVNTAAGATAITVSSAVVSATAKTVTLTLSRAVAATETVTVSYTKPESGAVVQDAAGNDAANFSSQPVTHSTATPPGTQGPTLAATDPITISDNKLSFGESATVTIRFAEAIATDSFTTADLTVGGGAKLSNLQSTDGGTTWTVTLAAPDALDIAANVLLANGSTGNKIRVNLTEITNRAGTAGVGTADSTITYDIDVQSPSVSSAAVNGDQLVLTYTEANTLDGAALAGNAGFTVNTAAGAAAITVSSAVVNATAKTVTLTLSRTVAATETVTVSYTKPATGAVVQDAAGNDAANFSDRAVTHGTTPAPADTTPPVFSSAVVNGNRLVLTYTEANTLDGAALAGNAGFTVNTAAGATAITVSSAVVNATDKTVTLTLSRAVANTETVTVSYTKPESGAVVQDAAGNDAVNFSSQAVTNSTPAPSALNVEITLADSALTTGETTTVTFTFNRPVNGFDSSDITCTSGTLSSPTANAASTVWTATFTPAANVNAPSNVINVALTGVTDAAGNAGVGEASSPNYTVDTRPAADTTAPVFSSATVTGNQLVLTYTEANTLDGAALTGNAGFTVNTAAGATAITVSSAVVNATAKTVTLTLSRTVAATETVTVSYTKPESGAVVQDAAGNDAVNFSSQAVTHGTPSDTTAPVINTAVVTGDKLVLSYTEEGSLDAVNTAAASAFAVSSAGNATISVNSVAVSGKTVTLTLSRAVTSTETLTVSYTKPTGNNVVQDAAGNDAVSFSNQTVTHGTPTPSDTTAPVLNTAVVIGNQLVLSYTDDGNLDATNTAAASAFAVNSAGNAVISVSRVAVSGKTVTLTLSRPVTSAETLTVSYTKPTSGDNVVQDAAGNDAVSFSNQTVTHRTRSDTTAPVINTAVVTGNQLVLTYTEAGTLDGAALAGNAGFTVNTAAGATAITVSSAVVNATDKTVTLTLSRAVAATETVSVSYTKPESGAVVQDAAGNDAANFSERAVTNNTPGTTPGADTTAPEINTAVVTGDKLVLTYREAGTLDATALVGNAGFTVNTAAGTTAITVTGVAVHITDKTVTLTLSRAVAATETVTVSYTKPTLGNGVRDAAGNEAVNFSNQAVTHGTPSDTTAPVINTAVVTGNQLVLTYTEAGTLDGAALAGNAGFTVNTAAGATAITVSSAVVSATAKTVTLTLSRAVASTETVTVSYTKPESGAVVQDAAGNDAANFSSQPVTHSTATPPGTQGPTLAATDPITISDNKLSFGESATVTIRFAEAIATDSFTTADLTVGGGAKLSNLQSTDGGTTWTVTLAAPDALDIAANVLLANGSTGNKIRVNLTEITNRAGTAGVGTADSTITYDIDVQSPSVSSAAVNGDQLVLTYTEANTLDGAALAGNAGFTVNTAAGAAAITVSSAVVNATAKTVTLTLSRTVAATETVTVSYTKPATGAVVQDAAGNDAANFSDRAVTHGTTPAPADTTPPVFSSAVVNGNRLVLTYTEANTLDGAALAGNAGFTVNTAAGATAITVSSAVVNATDKTVTLTLSRAVASTETVTVSYTKPESGAVVQDAAGNDAVNFSSQAVTNSTPAPSALNVEITLADSALTTGETTTVTFTFNRPVNGFDSSDITCTSGTLSSPTANAASTVWTATFTPAANVNAPSNVINVALTGVTDAAGNAGVGEASSPNYTVDTRPAADTTAPVFSSATVTGNQLVLTYTEANTLDGAALTGNAGFTVNTAAGATAITVSSAVVNATAKTVTLTLSRTVAATETVTVSYTKPESGAVVQDAAGNDAVNFSSQAVTHGTPSDTTAPVINTAVVTGDKLVLSYTEEGSLDAVNTAAASAFAVSSAGNATISVNSVAVSGKTVTLTLSRAVTSTETLTVSYTKPTGNNVVQDAAGNDAVSFSNQTVTHGTPTPSDTTAPVLNTAVVIGNQLVLSYTDDGNLDATNTAAASAFAVNSAGNAVISVSRVAVSGKTVTLTLSRPVTSAETLTVSYTKPTSGDNVVQDAAGNDAVSFSNQTVTHRTRSDTTAPVINTAVVTGNQLVLTYTEAGTLDGAALAGNAGFTVNTAAGATAITVSSAVVNATDKTVTLTLSRAVAATETVSVSYTKPESGAVVQDAAGNDAANFSERAVTNNTPGTTPGADTTAPEINTAVVTGDKLVLTYREAGTLDATALVGNAGFTVNTAAGTTAITVTGVAVHITDKTVTLTLSRAVAATETVTVSYTKPT